MDACRCGHGVEPYHVGVADDRDMGTSWEGGDQDNLNAIPESSTAWHQSTHTIRERKGVVAVVWV